MGDERFGGNTLGNGLQSGLRFGEVSLRKRRQDSELEEHEVRGREREPFVDRGARLGIPPEKEERERERRS
jgi:hypothetical protein